jgi:hypothetical protein
MRLGVSLTNYSWPVEPTQLAGRAPSDHATPMPSISSSHSSL